MAITDTASALIASSLWVAVHATGRRRAKTPDKASTKAENSHNNQDKTNNDKANPRRESTSSKSSPIKIKITTREDDSDEEYLPYPEPLSQSWASSKLSESTLASRPSFTYGPAPPSWSDEAAHDEIRPRIISVGPNGRRQAREIGGPSQEMEGMGEWTIGGGSTEESAGRGEWTIVDCEKGDEKNEDSRWAKGNWPFLEDETNDD